MIAGAGGPCAADKRAQRAIGESETMMRIRQRPDLRRGRWRGKKVLKKPQASRWVGHEIDFSQYRTGDGSMLGKGGTAAMTLAIPLPISGLAVGAQQVAA